MKDRILLVEDELSLRETIAYSLRRQNYDVLEVGDGAAALHAARKYRPNLLLLDVMLPGLDGFEVCRILRREMSIPIMMLTARDSEIDRVLGLELGADDYLTKPFSMRELVARVKSIFRRVRLEREASEAEALVPANGILNAGDLRVDLDRAVVTRKRTPLPLKPREYDLLVHFMLNPGKLMSRDVILDQVWGWDYDGTGRTVDVHVRWLREKIESDPAEPARIVTVRGKGYRFDG